MTRVLLDAELRAKLLNLDQPLELCDESGRVFAHVLPSLEMSPFENPIPELEEAELRRRRDNKGKTYSTSEVLARLDRL